MPLILTCAIYEILTDLENVVLWLSDVDFRRAQVARRAKSPRLVTTNHVSPCKDVNLGSLPFQGNLGAKPPRFWGRNVE